MTKTLRELREEKSITQVEMAAEIGWAPQTVGAWEIGQMPSMRARRDLAKFFGLSIPVMLAVLHETKQRTKLAADLSAVGA